MIISEQDRKMMKALRHLLDQGRFSLSWREAAAFYAIQKWIGEFDEKMNKPEPKPEAKDGDKPKRRTRRRSK